MKKNHIYSDWHEMSAVDRCLICGNNDKKKNFCCRDGNYRMITVAMAEGCMKHDRKYKNPSKFFFINVVLTEKPFKIFSLKRKKSKNRKKRKKWFFSPRQKKGVAWNGFYTQIPYLFQKTRFFIDEKKTDICLM